MRPGALIGELPRATSSPNMGIEPVGMHVVKATIGGHIADRQEEEALGARSISHGDYDLES